MASSGKIFENNWRKSVPENVFFYRFRDSSSGWNPIEELRFTPSNIADCLLFDSNKLYLCELKCHTGKSIPLNCIIGNKTKKKQVDDLLNASKFKNIKCYIIVFFSDIEKCYALDIKDFFFFMQDNDRKSIPISYFESIADEIEVLKLRTNYKYNIDKWLKEKSNN